MQHPIYADHGWCPRSTCGNPGSTIDVSGRGNASGQKPRQKRSQRKARSIGKQRSMKQRPTQGVRTPSSHVTLGYIFTRGAAIRQDTLPYLNGRLIIKKKREGERETTDRDRGCTKTCTRASHCSNSNSRDRSQAQEA